MPWPDTDAAAAQAGAGAAAADGDSIDEGGGAIGDGDVRGCCLGWGWGPVGLGCPLNTSSVPRVLPPQVHPEVQKILTAEEQVH